MLLSYFNITVIAEWCAFISGVLLLDKKTTVWRLFIPIIFITILAESIGWYLSVIRKIYNNAPPFNINLIITMGFLIVFFTTSGAFVKIKKIIYALLTLFLFAAVINLLFFQGFWVYNFYTEALGDLILASICCWFLFQNLRNEHYIYLLKDAYFWLANGLLFSSLGSALLYIFLKALQKYYLETHVDVYGFINYTLNIILYLSLIIAFICRRKTTR